MSKRAYISRYILLIRRLQRGAASYEELRDYLLQREEGMRDLDDTVQMAVSKRTLQRDFKEMENFFGVSIAYSRTQKAYYIQNQDRLDQTFLEMTEAMEVLQSLRFSRTVQDTIYWETRTPRGMQYLQDFLRAIKEKKRVRILYYSYWEETEGIKIVEPFALKEFRHRWYALAWEEGDFRCLALDRVQSLELLGETFEEKEFDVKEYYKNSFGIIQPFHVEPAEILLSFDHTQGRYIKSLPLHPSQKIILDTENELRISLYLCPTYDFLQELLSFGAKVKILQPSSLVQDLKEQYQAALQQYEL